MRKGGESKRRRGVRGGEERRGEERSGEDETVKEVEDARNRENKRAEGQEGPG